MGVKVATEADLQRTIIAYLEARGAHVVRVNSGAVRVEGRLWRANNRPGHSDLTVCYRGRYLALEVKGPRGRLTPVQASYLDAVRRAGGLAAVVRSTADVDAVLAEATKESEGP